MMKSGPIKWNKGRRGGFLDPAEKERRIRTAGFTPCWASARLFVPADRCYRRQSHGRRARTHRHAQLSGNHIGWRSINHYSQSDFTACILVQYDHKIFIDLFFASLFLLVIDIISDVISMSGSRLIVCVCVCCDSNVWAVLPVIQLGGCISYSNFSLSWKISRHLPAVVLGSALCPHLKDWFSSSGEVHSSFSAISKYV